MGIHLSRHKNYNGGESVPSDLENLFKNKDFHLIHVEDNGKMSLVTPYKDKSVRKKIREYRCISHVWGTGDKSKDYIWKDHDVKGVTWKVEVRKEKRERIMQIFNHHKGYFWLDVLCTNQDTNDKPLDVMGDIYRRCKECVCLLDTVCDVPGFDSERELWIDVAKDVKEYMETDMERMDNKYDNLYKRIECNSSDISFGEKYLQYLMSITTAKWFQRVWTWQEAALPPKLLFCSEQARTYRYDPYSAKLLERLFPYKCVEKDLLRMSYGDFTISHVDRDSSEKLGHYSAITHYIMSIKFFSAKRDDIWDNVKTMVVSEKECTIREDLVYGVTGILDVTVQADAPFYYAVSRLKDGLQVHGISYIETQPYVWNPKQLRDLYVGTTFVDGFRVPGEISNAPDEFGDYNVLGYEEYEVSKKNTHKDGIRYTCIHETGFWDVWFRNDYSITRTYEEGSGKKQIRKYDIGDTMKFTKIGRKGATFEVVKENKFGASMLAELTDNFFDSIGTITPTEGESLTGAGDQLEE